MFVFTTFIFYDVVLCFTIVYDFYDVFMIFTMCVLFVAICYMFYYLVFYDFCIICLRFVLRVFTIVGGGCLGDFWVTFG